MTWMYFRFWVNIIGNLRTQPVFPSMPLLFIYGRNKNIMFHTKEMLHQADMRDDCYAKGIDAGHWVQHEASGKVCRLVKSWLDGEMRLER
jgi:hypothetical protein